MLALFDPLKFKQSLREIEYKKKWDMLIFSAIQMLVDHNVVNLNIVCRQQIRTFQVFPLFKFTSALSECVYC